MISVDEARERILRGLVPTPTERVALLDGLGLVLAEDAVATLNLPPFDSAAMDGFAIRVSDVVTGSRDRPVTLEVIGEAAAGAPTSMTVVPGTAIRIMTGAVVPSGADAVVPFEQTDDSEPDRQVGLVRVFRSNPDRPNVRLAGQDVRSGRTIMATGVGLGARELGILASLGQSTVPVHRRPRIAIISTGDELVAPGEPLHPAQIYDANGVALAALVRQAGGEPRLVGITGDRVDALRQRLREARSADLIITSGGVSHGDFDIVKDLLAEAGSVQFWQVAMKPGRPLGFGWIDGQPLIGLPGNPGAALVSFEQFARPAIRALMGHTSLTRPEVSAIVRGTATNLDGLRCFLRARVERREGQLVATLNPGRAVHSSFPGGQANALVIVPENLLEIRDGDCLNAQILAWED